MNLGVAKAGKIETGKTRQVKLVPTPGNLSFLLSGKKGIFTCLTY